VEWRKKVVILAYRVVLHCPGMFSKKKIKSSGLTRPQADKNMRVAEYMYRSTTSSSSSAVITFKWKVSVECEEKSFLRIGERKEIV